MKQTWIIAVSLCVTTALTAQDTVKNNVPVMPGSSLLQKPGAENAPQQPAINNQEIKTTAMPEIKPGTALLLPAKKENTGILSGKDFLTMFADQLYITRNGKAELVTTDITLDDGTVIMNNGTIKTSAGKTIRLKNGLRYPGVQNIKKQHAGR